MNFLIKRLADEKSYYPIYLTTLVIYALTGCLTVGWAVDHHPTWVGRIAFLFMFGSAGVAYGFRVAHNLAYAKVHNDDK